jgi:hypothetical protein
METDDSFIHFDKLHDNPISFHEHDRLCLHGKHSIDIYLPLSGARWSPWQGVNAAAISASLLCLNIRQISRDSLHRFISLTSVDMPAEYCNSIQANEKRNKTSRSTGGVQFGNEPPETRDNAKSEAEN